MVFGGLMAPTRIHPQALPAADEAPAAQLAESLEKLRPGILLVLRQHVGRTALAEDLCSEAIRIVLERLQREPLEDPARLAGYLAQTARNLAAAEKRKEARRRTVTGADQLIEQEVDEGADPSGDLQQRARAEAVHRMLARLPTARDRLLLVRYYLEDEDRETICRDLGITPAHFNRVIFRARERLRVLLKRRYRSRDLLGILV